MTDVDIYEKIIKESKILVRKFNLYHISYLDIANSAFLSIKEANKDEYCIQSECYKIILVYLRDKSIIPIELEAVKSTIPKEDLFQCKKCFRTLHHTDFYYCFCKNKNYKVRRTRCKDCERKDARENPKRIAARRQYLKRNKVYWRNYKNKKKREEIKNIDDSYSALLLRRKGMELSVINLDNQREIIERKRKMGLYKPTAVCITSVNNGESTNFKCVEHASKFFEGDINKNRHAVRYRIFEGGEVTL